MDRASICTAVTVQQAGLSYIICFKESENLEHQLLNQFITQVLVVIALHYIYTYESDIRTSHNIPPFKNKRTDFVSIQG